MSDSFDSPDFFVCVSVFDVAELNLKGRQASVCQIRDKSQKLVSLHITQVKDGGNNTEEDMT